MNVFLTPDLVKLIEEEMRTGGFESAEGVIREALRLLKERDDRVGALRVEIRAGFEAIARCEYDEYDAASTPALAADIKRRGRERLEATKRKTGTG
jgi:antitoxin ParD1/3/4